MCQPTKQPTIHEERIESSNRFVDDHPQRRKRDYCWWPPISPWLVAAMVPCILPTWCYLNRGYTQWFHWNALLYVLLTAPNLAHAQFLALQGCTVTLGWYASLAYDWYQHGRWGHILYWNMPSVMTQYMIVSEQGDGNTNGNPTVIYTATSMSVMALAHVLDTIGHPILAYYFWKTSAPSNDIASCSRKSASSTHSGGAWHSFWTRFSWPVIFGSYLLSRGWSVLHTWYNHGSPSLFYFGYDVYTILDRDAWLEGLWLPAYIMEAAVYLVLVLGKACSSGSRTATTKSRLDRMPSMRRSSTVSEMDD